MESKLNNSISVDIPNYTGPLEILLDLAKTQKVDLTKISITKLADQFLDYIKKAQNLNLEILLSIINTCNKLSSTLLRSKIGF